MQIRPNLAMSMWVNIHKQKRCKNRKRRIFLEESRTLVVFVSSSPNTLQQARHYFVSIKLTWKNYLYWHTQLVPFFAWSKPVGLCGQYNAISGLPSCCYSRQQGSLHALHSQSHVHRPLGFDKINPFLSIGNIHVVRGEDVFGNLTYRFSIYFDRIGFSLLDHI